MQKNSLATHISIISIQRELHATPADLSSSYKLVQAKVGPAFDNATMERAVILDASIGPPDDALSSPSPSPSSSPAPPNGAIVASCTSRLCIREDFGNYNGVLHGGAAAVIFDMTTTIALGPVARPGFWE